MDALTAPDDLLFRCLLASLSWEDGPIRFFVNGRSATPPAATVFQHGPSPLRDVKDSCLAWARTLYGHCWQKSPRISECYVASPGDQATTRPWVWTPPVYTSLISSR